jgi:hypothetical protein
MLNEAKEWDLQKYYNEFNKEYFQGKLGNYPMRYNKSKYRLGTVVSFGYRNDPSSWEIKEVTISGVYSFTEDYFKGVLLHEMIHVWQIENNIYENPNNVHDKVFLDKVKEFNKITPFNIPEKEESGILDVDSKGRSRAVVTLNDFSVMIFDQSKTEEVVQSLKSLPKGWLLSNKVKVFLTDNPQIEQYPIKRKLNLRKITSIGIDISLLKDILRNGDLVVDFSTLEEAMAKTKDGWNYEDSFITPKIVEDWRNLVQALETFEKSCNFIEDSHLEGYLKLINFPIDELDNYLTLNYSVYKDPVHETLVTN